jgi:hypothetical protein
MGVRATARLAPDCSKPSLDGGMPARFWLMRSRAFRRHQEQRIKRRVAGYYGGYARENPRAIGQLARTRTPCSCWMCGNARRYFKEPTLQEQRTAPPLYESAL